MLTILGGIAIPAGIGVIGAELPCHPGSEEPTCDAGIGVAVVGVITLGAGITMMVVGGKRVTDGEEAPAQTPPPGRFFSSIDLNPHVIGLPGGAGLRWTF